jgi:hypothetical protein
VADAKKSSKGAAARRARGRAGGAKKPGAKESGAKKSVAKKPAAKKSAGGKRVELVDGGRYVLIEGRRWRATAPGIPEEERVRLVGELMRARRDVGRALRANDAEAEREARARVHAAKVALGERGEKWWERDAAAKKKGQRGS